MRLRRGRRDRDRSHHRTFSAAWSLVGCALAAGTVAGCGGGAPPTGSARSSITQTATSSATRPRAAEPVDVYRHDRAGLLSAAVAGDRRLVYVPNSESDTVSVISQRTMKVIATYPTGGLPQHVTPSWDLKTLWVDNDQGNSLTPIDPRTGRPGWPVAVADPYNLYFTPDGRYAIVVAERLRRLDFRDPHTMKLHDSLTVPQCAGVDHMDFSASGRFAYASCEFSGRMIEIDLSDAGSSRR